MTPKPEGSSGIPVQIEQAQITVRKAARALARAGLVGPYGHCSMRIDGRSFLVCAAKPMGMIKSGEQGTLVAIDGPLPNGVLGEVRVHQQIYKARPTAGGVCRVLPPKLMSLSALGRTPQVRHGFGAYFAPHAPLWSDPGLLRSDERAAGVARALGSARAIVLRGNGAITVGASLEEAAVLASFLEDAARVELDVLAADPVGDHPVYSATEAEKRATWVGRVVERMWDYLCDGDPEAEHELQPS